MAAASSNFGPFHFDPVEWRLTRDGVAVPLQDKALVLIAALLERPGGLWTRDELYARLWPGVFVSDDALFQVVRKARQALGDDPRTPRWIETVQGRGYRFLGEVISDAPPAASVAPSPAPEPTRRSPEAGVRCRAPSGLVIGRELELAAIRAHLADGARVVTLLGPAGAGKTTLALVEGATHGEHSRFVDLLEATDADTILHALGEGLGADSGGPEAARALLRALPDGPDALVVLDNAELCTRALGVLVLDWLARAPRVRFLVTSRRPLEVSAEQIVPVGPLKAGAAARVFRARAAARGVVLTDEDRALVDDVVSAVDGLPLALELAASRVGMLGLGGLLERLRAPLEVLRANRLDLPERHRSIRAALELSWSALDPEERRFLSGCCVFRAPFRIEDAEAVVPGPDHHGPPALDLAQAIIDASLVQTVNDGGRRLLRPYVAVRELAVELGDPTWIEAVRHRHLSWLAGMSAGLEAGEEPGPRAQRLLGPLLEDGAQALRFGVEHGRLQDAARVAAWLVPVMARRGAGLRALELLAFLGEPEAPEIALALTLLRALVYTRGIAPERAPALFERVADQAALAGRADVELQTLIYWANTAISRNVTLARSILARAAAALQRAPRPASSAILLSLEAQLRAFEGDTEAARRGAAQALERLSALDQGWWVARTMLDLAEIDLQEHRFADAERQVLRALEIYEQAQAPAAVDHALTFLGVIRQGQGRLPEALELYGGLRVRARRAGNVQLAQSLALNIGGVLGDLGRLEEASQAFDESLSLAREQGNAVHESLSLIRLAGVSWRRGRWAAARAQLLAAIQSSQGAGRPILAETARIELGHLGLLTGAWSEAEQALAEARANLELLEQTRSRSELARAMWAEAAGQLGRPDALREAAAAVETLRQTWPDEGLARGLSSLGLLCLAAGKVEEARAHLAEADAIRAAAGDTDGDLARDVARLRERLSPSVVT